MNYEKEDVIKFERGEYLILNVIRVQGNTYLYLINNAEDKDDVSVVKVIETGYEPEYVPIEDDKEFEMVMNILIIENQDLIKKAFSEEENQE